MSQTTLSPTTRQWVVQNHAEADIKLSGQSATFALKEETLPTRTSLQADSLIVQILYLSNDPAQRLWIQKASQVTREDMKPIPEGSLMRAFSVARVVVVGGDYDAFKEGDLVLVTTGWAEYAVVKKSAARLVQSIPGVSPSAWLGALGLSGLTAYWGLVGVLNVKHDQTLVVSGAAGAVGNVVVQLAKKVFGVSKVVAIAGSKEKCEWLKTIGADAAVNYRSPTFAKDLVDATPKMVDGFFDNVGGDVLDIVLTRLKAHGVIAACGGIASYNNQGSLKNYVLLIANRLQLLGFTVMDYMDRKEEAMGVLVAAVKENKLVLEGAEMMVDCKGKFEDIPKAWTMLFSGGNTGKLITVVAE